MRDPRDQKWRLRLPEMRLSKVDKRSDPSPICVVVCNVDVRSAAQRGF